MHLTASATHASPGELLAQLTDHRSFPLKSVFATACSFQLINQRRDVVFLLFYNVSRSTGYTTRNLLARSAPLKLLDPNDPQHIHLALSQIEGYAPETAPMAAMSTDGSIWRP